MEIARLEVSMQQHLDRMQETAKVNYVQYGKSTKSKKKKPQSSAGATSQGQVATKQGQVTTGDPDPVENPTKDLLYCLTPATDVGRGDTKRHRTARLWMPLAEGVERKDIMRKFAYRENALHTLWRHHRPIQQGLGPVNPYISTMRDSQSTLTWSVSPHVNKHLIKFPVALDPTTLKGNNVDSPQSTVLLKADTGADVNLMNRKKFHQLFGDSQVLKPTPIKMENYGNSAVKVLEMFHAFLRWKDKVYRQLFYMTDCGRSPNLLSRDACYILGVLKPCHMVEKATTRKTTLSPTVNACAKGDVVAKSFHHQKMNGSEEKLSNDSNQHSISQSQLKDHPLTKQDILKVYSDVFTGIGKFPGMPYKFQLKENAKPTRHAPRKVPIHLQDAFHSEIRNLEKLGILEETKDVTE